MLKLGAKLCFLFLILLSISAYAQVINRVDALVKNYPADTNLESLVLRLNNDFKTDAEKVRAVFIWITDNIEYQPQAEQFKTSEQFVYYSEFGKQYQLDRIKREKLTAVLESKKGICSDYSLLLNTLLDKLKISSVTINGVGKFEISNRNEEPYYKNHSWNAVFLEGKWQLLDATWASGYVDSQNNIFQKDYLEHYYLADPERFIKDHFPSDPKWQLIDQPIDFQTFMSSPIFFPYFFELGLELSPNTSGVIDSDTRAIYFKNLPDPPLLSYKIDKSNRLRKLELANIDEMGYGFRFNLNSRTIKNSDYLTVYANGKAVLKFRLVN